MCGGRDLRDASDIITPAAATDGIGGGGRIVGFISFKGKGVGQNSFYCELLREFGIDRQGYSRWFRNYGGRS